MAVTIKIEETYLKILLLIFGEQEGILFEGVYIIIIFCKFKAGLYFSVSCISHSRRTISF